MPKLSFHSLDLKTTENCINCNDNDFSLNLYRSNHSDVPLKLILIKFESICSDG